MLAVNGAFGITTDGQLQPHAQFQLPFDKTVEIYIERTSALGMMQVTVFSCLFKE